MSKRVPKVLFVLVVVSLLGGVAQIGVAQTKPIELSWSHYVPPTGFVQTVGIQWWQDELDRRTNGQVKFKIYPSSILGSQAEHYDMAVKGIADICYFVPGSTPGRFLLTEVFSLPTDSVRSGEKRSPAVWATFKRYVAQEYPDTHVIYMACTAGYHLMTKNKAIRTLDDFKGLKIRAIGAGMTDCVKALGAVPVSMPASEIYNAIERGVIDGTLFHRGGLVEFNFKDVVNYLTYLGLAGPVSTATMNLKTWNSLPPNVRQAFMDLEEPAAPFAGKMYDDNDLRGLEAFRAKGGEEIYLSDADMKKAFELFKPIVDKWVAETAAKGKPAAATLDYFMQEINKIKY